MYLYNVNQTDFAKPLGQTAVSLGGYHKKVLDDMTIGGVPP